MPKTYISLDLETTGLDAAKDAIIEIGATRFDGAQELESFSTFVNPGRNVPHFITELTGITNADVAGAPPIRRVAEDLRDFVGRDTVVGHNIGFDLAFLHRHNILVGNSRIDTFELAAILVPHAERYSLANLVQVVGLKFPPQTHRALDDARMAHALFVALLERAKQLPRATLQEIARLGEHVNWGPRFFFQEALRSHAREGFQGSIGAQLASRRGGDVAGPLFLPEVEFDPLEARAEPRLLDVAALSALLDEAGPLADAFAVYEARTQQRAMLEAVATAFNASHHLLVEAGTGTGKSLAYLIPAVKWADMNDARVVISTNTINLQEQLAGSDVPLLARVFPTGFRAMVLKGRSHYLCRRQFEALRRHGPSDEDEIRVLAKVLLWLPNTLDGDGDGLFLPTTQERAVWARLNAAAENCDAQNCRYFRGEGCFFYRARERAETAHILIVNHALLLADIAAENRVLPEYEHLIVDEAHHLEDATTEALHFSVSWFTLRYTLEELTQGHGGFPGLLEEFSGLAQTLDRNLRVALMDAIVRASDATERALGRLEGLFDALEQFLEEHAPGGNGNYSARLRITSGLRTQPGWDNVELAWDTASGPFALLVDMLNRLLKGLDELSAVEAPELDAPRSRFMAATRRLAEAHAQLHALIVKPAANAIYWLEEGWNRGPISFHSVPLNVGPLVREHLFDKKKSVILTSATLQVGGAFDYLRERLEAWDAEAVAVGSPFDYASAALLYVATDVPEPGNPGHQKAVEEALLKLFIATEGRALALFTSYSQLQSTAQALTGPLARAGINVYMQGAGSSRVQLVENFRKDERAVLLGTRSFWEGVDIPGEALSCLAIVKLPFDVPNDPVVAARAEVCDNAFNDYMVPEAILRFLQGFGRLIRTRDDRGIVAVLDGRLVTKRYGQRFLDSLPGPTVRIGPARELSELAALWLAKQPLPPAPERAVNISRSAPPMPEEPPDWF